MSDLARRQQSSGRLRAACELLLAISAGVTGLAGMAYFLFAPRLTIGTASPGCDAISNPSACIPASHYNLIETTFSPGWGLYFALLALLFASILVLAMLHIRTSASRWRWALIVAAVLIILGSAPLNNSLLIISPIAVLQDGVALWPGIVLALCAAIVALLDRRPSGNPNSAPAIQQ